MTRLGFTLLLILASLTSSNAISVTSQCWLESNIYSMLGLQDSSSTTYQAVASLLAAFYKESIAQSQGNGLVAKDWAQNSAWFYLYHNLSNGAMSGLKSNLQSSNASSLCQAGIDSLNILNSASLTNDQYVQSVLFLELSYESVTQNGCSIWDLLRARQSLSSDFTRVGAGLSCEKRKILYSATGCDNAYCY